MSGHATTADHHGHTVELGPFAVVAEFATPEELLAAAERARDAGYKMDCYSPYPIHGLSEAMGFDCKKVPWSIFFGGIAGACAGLGLQAYVNMGAYPLNVGNRPLFSWPSFIPVTYECTILFASLTAVFGMIAFNSLPLPYHPIFNTPNFERCSQDRFFLGIELAEGDTEAADAEKFLKGLKPINVSVVFPDEEGSW